MLDVGVLLASTENQKEDIEASVGIADHGGLRPPIRANGGDRHDAIGIENCNRGMFQRTLLQNNPATQPAELRDRTELRSRRFPDRPQLVWRRPRSRKLGCIVRRLEGEQAAFEVRSLDQEERLNVGDLNPGYDIEDADMTEVSVAQFLGFRQRRLDR